MISICCLIASLAFGSSFGLIRLVPLLGDLFLPVRLLRQLVHSILNDRQSLPHFIVLHVLLIVKFVHKFQQVVNLGLLFLLNLFCSLGPGGLSSRSLLLLIARGTGRLCGGP